MKIETEFSVGYVTKRTVLYYKNKEAQSSTYLGFTCHASSFTRGFNSTKQGHLLSTTKANAKILKTSDLVNLINAMSVTKLVVLKQLAVKDLATKKFIQAVLKTRT